MDKQWESIVYDKIRRFLSKKEENIVAAAILLDFISNIEKRYVYLFFPIFTNKFLNLTLRTSEVDDSNKDKLFRSIDFTSLSRVFSVSFYYLP